jgi:hypothetical protein
VLAHEIGHAGVDLLPLLVRADGRERRRRDLDAEVELAERSRVDEGALASGPDEKPAHVLERLLRRGETDALDRPARQGFEALQREGEVASPLVPRERVDLVHDDGRDGPEHSAAAVARQEQIERLRRRDQDVRRPPDHCGALARRSVARPHQDADLRDRRIERPNLFERPLQVLLDVVRQRAKRRDVEDLRLVGESVSLAHQGVDR